MGYHVTVLDRNRDFLTAYLAPDREPLITHAAVATNHQERVEWKSHARFTATVEREFTNAFLKPPLYSLAFSHGFGTLYTAAYRPAEGELEVLWPGRRWVKSFDDFPEDSVTVNYPAAFANAAEAGVPSFWS